MVTLEPLSESNRAAAIALRVAPSQRSFVSTVAESLREAAEHPAAHARCFVVRADSTVVGFAMVADEVDDPTYIPHYLWKLLIDARHQRRGYGTAALDLLTTRSRTLGAPFLTTSAHDGPGSPISFYERYGFTRTDEVADGAVLLRLPLR